MEAIYSSETLVPTYRTIRGLCSYIPERLGPYLGPNAVCSGWGLSRFLQFPHENAGIILRLGHDRFLPNPFQFVIYQSSCRSMLHSLRYWHRRKTKHKNKFWEDLSTYFPWYDTGHIENHTSNNSFTVVCVFVTAVTFLPSRCLVTTEWYTYRHTDWWVFINRPLRWAQMPRYTYQVS
jgi:hypothetical protein